MRRRVKGMCESHGIKGVELVFDGGDGILIGYIMVNWPV